MAQALAILPTMTACQAVAGFTKELLANSDRLAMHLVPRAISAPASCNCCTISPMIGNMIAGKLSHAPTPGRFPYRRLPVGLAQLDVDQGGQPTAAAGVSPRKSHAISGHAC